MFISSDGVGRTGTYIAVDYFIQFIDDQEFDVDINVFDFVLKLRNNRREMVQTEVGLFKMIMPYK